ncbi:BnaA02g33050D [Brassica napus]|uniref:BnaA02g33050D protein n=1 Tax=Brassica napus TaxID=3708 RepID=A0A078IAR7_BRANA|nr:BnaA02g33050D [Brassica napus]
MASSLLTSSGMIPTTGCPVILTLWFCLPDPSV